jgi:hypothetical protein
MTENGESTRVAAGPGSVGLGLLQSFGVYALGLAVLVAAAASRSGGGGTLVKTIAALSFALSLALGVWHSNRGRARTACGAVMGALLWPAILLALVVWAFVHTLSHTPIPF